MRQLLNSKKLSSNYLGVLKSSLAWRTPHTLYVHKTFTSGCLRLDTTEAGSHNSGHIKAGPHGGILFVEKVFPLRLQWLLRLFFQGERYIERIENPSIAGFDPAELVRKAVPQDHSLKILGTFPRFKEGGAFVTFQHDGTVSNTDVERSINTFLAQKKVSPWWNPFTNAQSHLVRGKPWVEDLFRLPSRRLRVEFLDANNETATELSQEQLYSIFRPYGKLAEIYPQPPDSKIMPRYALLDYALTKPAVVAKNCLHGFVYSEPESNALAKLKISYEARTKSNWVREWIMNHPRVVLPILAALAAAITVAIFDPIRTFYVKAHITRTFHLTDNRFYKVFVGWLSGTFSRHGWRARPQPMQAIWSDRKENIEQIESWLMETADTFIVVQGPRGSGKRELVVDEALKNKKYKLIIDCKPVQEARGDSAKINALARETGYKPVFSWLNSISGLIDLAAQGATGIKTGFTETLDGQMTKILNNTATALQQLALEGRKKDDSDAKLTDDVYLEAHPERRPVVVIDNFLHKSQDGQMTYDKIADWAAMLTTANIAHIVILTHDVSFSKSLSKALPDRVFRQISLGDCAPEVAKRFVISHLQSDTQDAEVLDENGKPEAPLSLSKKQRDLAELDDCISYLGGRLTDLEFLARRMKAGETPTKAVNEIIEQSASEILKMFLFNAIDGTQSRHWTREQAWILIKRLAESENLRYNEVIYTSPYAGSANADAVLQSLEQAELITIVSSNGRPTTIKPGKPVYQRAFKILTDDAVLRSRMDSAVLVEQIKGANASIEKLETELYGLAQLPKQPTEIAPRVHWLLTKIEANQKNIEGWEKKNAELGKILTTQF